MNKQQKNDAVQVANAIANIDAKKAVRATIPAETSGGSLNANLTITLSDSYIDSGCHVSLPKQVRIALAMVWNEFEGQCTLRQLDDAWFSSSHSDMNGGKYTQGIINREGYKSFFSHYFSPKPTKNLTMRKNALTSEQYQEHILIS
jgi:hypothetical protein